MTCQIDIQIRGFKKKKGNGNYGILCFCSFLFLSACIFLLTKIFLFFLGQLLFERDDQKGRWLRNCTESREKEAWTWKEKNTFYKKKKKKSWCHQIIFIFHGVIYVSIYSHARGITHFLTVELGISKVWLG